jgi:hypothetical protein
VNRPAVVEALVADGWEAEHSNLGFRTLKRGKWTVCLWSNGRVGFSDGPPYGWDMQVELRPSVPDDEVVRIIAAVCAPDLFGGAA